MKQRYLCNKNAANVIEYSDKISNFAMHKNIFVL